MKRCTICKKEFSLDCFNKKRRSPDGLQDVCRPCNRERSRAYYANNKTLHVQNVRERTKRIKEQNREYLFNYFKENPCVDCGNPDVRVLEFDHREGSDKINGVAQMVSGGYSLRSIIEEIKKCDVRCRNCHQIKTFERMGGTWHDKFMSL